MPFVTLGELAAFSPQKMQKRNFFSCPQIAADLYCLSPGQQQKVHVHGGEAKMYLVLEGRGEFTLGAEKRTLAAGQAACAPAGVEHGVSNPFAERLLALVAIAPRPASIAGGA